MGKLFAKQVAKATSPSGDVDLEALGQMVTTAYDEADRDRRRTDRSIALMVEELERLQHQLEGKIAERTHELRERESELRAQNLRFDAAINNMSQGLLMMDAHGRVVICNHRYLNMYGLKPEHAQPGIHLSELFRNRAAIGTFSGNPDEYAADMLAQFCSGHIRSRVVEIGDGRTVAISNRIMPGIGWVSTQEDITERREAEKKIAHMAHHDALTNLPNRLLLRERLAHALRAIRRGQTLAVHYLDLDHFKTVNDSLGHPIGDELLLKVATRLRACVRETECVARVGGDEFAIVQSGIETPAEAGALALRIREAINAPYNLNGHIAIVNASVGIAMAPGDGEEPDVLITNADLALDRAKADGRGTYRFFEPDMDARMQARRSLELALRNALPNGEFELHYQPVVNLADHVVTSCEALIRWSHPQRGLISPSEFIPVAEEIGLIIALGEWVIRKACADAATWPDDIKVAVNLSPTQLLSQNLLPLIVQTLAATGLASRRLVVEITEEVLMQNTETTIATLYQLRSLGVQIALDDFGTGYSSLSYLRSFPFDKLKIDRCFISGLGDGEESVNIVRAVTGLARSMQMETTAEGVEIEEQLQQVRDLGCTEMQGFLFSRPVPQHELMRLLADKTASRRSAA
ncbi:MAG: putative bifunctional diguanylate cyclase/phosphodiesterase [Xanthobacteraceae bacterium]